MEYLDRIALVIVLVGSGLLLMWIAVATASGRLGRNHLAGIRIPSTMKSDEAWVAAHKRSRPHVFGAGVVALAAGIVSLLPLSGRTIAVIVLVAAILMVALVVRGAFVGGRAARTLTGSGK